MTINYPMGFMQREITVGKKGIETKTKRIMVWINPKRGHFYHKEANSSCMGNGAYKKVRLGTIKRRKNISNDEYRPCPTCYGHLKGAK